MDPEAVSDVVLEFARSLDGKDWATCRRCLLDQIETDYSDLRGEPPSRVQADDFVAKRRVALERLKTHCTYTHSLARTPAGWRSPRSSKPSTGTPATPMSTQAPSASHLPRPCRGSLMRSGGWRRGGGGAAGGVVPSRVRAA